MCNFTVVLFISTVCFTNCILFILMIPRWLVVSTRHIYCDFSSLLCHINHLSLCFVHTLCDCERCVKQQFGLTAHGYWSAELPAVRALCFVTLPSVDLHQSVSISSNSLASLSLNRKARSSPADVALVAATVTSPLPG